MSFIHFDVIAHSTLITNNHGLPNNDTHKVQLGGKRDLLLGCCLSFCLCA